MCPWCRCNWLLPTLGLACGGHHRAWQSRAAVALVVALVMVAAAALAARVGAGQVDERGGKKEAAAAVARGRGRWDEAGDLEVAVGEGGAAAQARGGAGQQRGKKEIVCVREGFCVAQWKQVRPSTLEWPIWRWPQWMMPARGGSSRKLQAKASGGVGGGTVEHGRQSRSLRWVLVGHVVAALALAVARWRGTLARQGAIETVTLLPGVVEAALATAAVPAVPVAAAHLVVLAGLCR